MYRIRRRSSKVIDASRLSIPGPKKNKICSSELCKNTVRKVSPTLPINHKFDTTVLCRLEINNKFRENKDHRPSQIPPAEAPAKTKAANLWLV